MKAPARLGLYGLVLVAVFAVAGFTANAVVPEETVQSWAEDTADTTHHEEGDAMNGDEHEGHNAGASSLGLGLAQDGYQLTAVTAPTATGTAGELALTITGSDGNPVTDFELEHEKELHLIAVRADGQHFRHVHPEMDDDGTWTIPWQWEAAGSYRVFADFVPADTGEGITLDLGAGGWRLRACTGDRAGHRDHRRRFRRCSEGDLIAGSASELTITVTRDGEPVTALEPYLGAFGHLVALRDGDLAYLHVHPHGDAPEVGDTSGPEIVFEATAPTPGRYLLFLDFQIDGEVRTAPLVIDTTTGVGDNGTGHSGGEHFDTESSTGEEHEEGAGHGH